MAVVRVAVVLGGSCPGGSSPGGCSPRTSRETSIFRSSRLDGRGIV